MSKKFRHARHRQGLTALFIELSIMLASNTCPMSKRIEMHHNVMNIALYKLMNYYLFSGGISHLLFLHAF